MTAILDLGKFDPKSQLDKHQIKIQRHSTLSKKVFTDFS